MAETVQVHRYPNGLTLIHEETPGWKGMAMGAFIRAGARDESDAQSGSAHFLEHMLFKGTRKRPGREIVQKIEEAGGDFNAYTTSEYTCFHLFLLNRDWALGAELLQEVLREPVFPKSEFEKERKVVLQELAGAPEVPEEFAFDLLFEKLYKGEGLGRRILGKRALVRKTDLKEVKRFYKTHYRPDRIILSVAGVVEFEAVKAAFSAWGEDPLPKTKSIRKKTTSIETGRWWLTQESEQAHLIWAFNAFPIGDPDDLILSMWTHDLGSGMSSQLFDEVREKRGLAYQVSASVYPATDSGLLVFYLATARSKAGEGSRVMQQLFERWKSEPLTEKRLQSLKRNFTGFLLLSSEGADARMMTNGYHELYYRKHPQLEEVCQRVEEASLSDFKRVADRILSSNPGFLGLGPKALPGTRPTKRSL